MTEHVTKDDLVQVKDDLQMQMQLTVSLSEARQTIKLESLKKWGVAALLGGQVGAGTIAALMPDRAVEIAKTAASILPL